MNKIPLFPLNTVLFPGVPLNLHIFEARYKEMIGFCLEEKQPFGVVLIRRGQEAHGPAEPYEIGCSASIIQNEPLEDGRMNIAAVGVERFRIAALDRERSYLMGEVESFPVLGLQDESLQALADRLRPWVRQYLQTISDSMPENVDAAFLPDEPVALAYIAAFLVQAPAAEKQKLLELTTMPEMLEHLDLLYRRELAILRALIEGEEPPEDVVGLN